QGYLSYVYITVSGSNHTQVFLANAFTGSGKLSHSTYGSRFRRLSACVRIYFCIENQDVHILARGNYVVESTETNIIRPTVATNDPLRLFYQILCQTGNFGTNSTF